MSILHLPKNELKNVLDKMKTALSKRGIIYTSFKYGTFEGYWLETIVNLISQDVTACQSGIRFSDYLQKINM